jgi:hypothetical protein
LNIHDTNGCRAYIDKLEYFGTNFSPGKLIISASASGYANTNYYFDDTRGDHSPGTISTASAAKTGVLNVNPNASVVYSNIVDTGDFGTFLLGHITNGVNVAGYLCWGAHSSLGSVYSDPSNVRCVRWSGNSGWWIIATVESYNGQWTNNCADMGNVSRWFSNNAFSGTNYSNMPIGAVSHTDEPGDLSVSADQYFGLWEMRKNFAICSWVSHIVSTPHPYFQVVGDPFITK